MRGPLLQPIFQPIMRPIVRAVLGASRGGRYNGPSLALRFGENQYLMGAIGKKPDAYKPEGLITFTRSTSAWEWDWQGNYSEVAAGVMRIAHDPLTKSTSTTPQTIGTGSYTFAVTYQYPVGKAVRVSADANNWMVGRVTASTPDSVTIWVSGTPVGAGTYSAWTLIVRRGIRVEEQRTNLLTNSGNAGLWSKNTANLSAVITGTPAPAAGVGAVWWDVSDTGSGDDFFSAVLSVANDRSPCTATIFVEKTANALNAVCLGVFFSGGTTHVAGFATLNTNSGEIRTASTVLAATVEDLGACWRLILSVANNATGNTSCNWRFYPAYKLNATAGSARDNAVTGSARVVGRGLEVGATPSSHIPTGASQVIRAADVPVVNTLSPWFNAAEGALVVRATTTNNSFATVFQISDGTPSNEIRLIGWNDGSSRLSVIQGGTGFAPALSGQNSWLPRTGAQFKMAAAYKTGVEFSYAGSGGTPVTRLSTLSPVGSSQLRLGSTVGNLFFLNGIIESIIYHPRVTDTQQASV